MQTRAACTKPKQHDSAPQLADVDGDDLVLGQLFAVRKRPFLSLEEG
jgi:hypothetical protein